MSSGVMLLVSLLVALCLVTPAFAVGSSDISSANGTDDRTIDVAVVPAEHYAYQDANGVWTGYDIEYIDNIAQHAGFKVNIRVVESPSETYAGLADGSIDMASDMGKTEARTQQYLFSSYEQGTSTSSLFVRRDDDRWEHGDMTQVSNMRIGALAGDAGLQMFETWCGANGLTPAIRTYDSRAAVMQALDAGEVDAVPLGTVTYAGYTPILTFSTTPYYFMFEKDDALLKQKVDTAMEQISVEDPFYEQTLAKKYLSYGSVGDAQLTRAEKEYIGEHPTATVAVLDGDKPYYYRASDGSSRGVLPELYGLIAQQTGLSFTYRSYKTQDEAVAALKSGEADILGMYSDGIPYASAQDLRITRSYATVTTVMVTRAGKDTGDIRSVAAKNRSRNAVLQSLGDADIEFVGYDTASECFAAVGSGRVDAMVCGLPSATWLINQTNSAAYNIVPLSNGSLSLCGAVTYDNTMLCSIMNEGIQASSGKVDGIVASNTLQESTWQSSVSSMPPLVILLVVAILVVAVIMLVIALLSFRRRQSEKTAVAAAQAANERREAELAIMEQSTQERNDFFSNISHDMRTPLNAIIGYAKLAEENEDLPAETVDYLSKIQTSGSLLNALIDDTLTISKINSGKYDLHLEPVDTNYLVDSIAIPIRAIAEDRGQTFDVDVTGLTKHRVMADPLSIQKVFLNLLTNSVKYTPEGGHIVFKVADGRRHIGGREYVVTVSDDGIGMSEAFLPHIYDAFVQERRDDAVLKGTGLGLSIVKQLVELMGGTIDVESAEGKGTVFTVHLKLDDAAAEEAAASVSRESTPPERSYEGRHVLLVEDNEMNSEIARTMLEHWGFEVTCATNGEEGVRAFEASEPGDYSAILMDIRMPVMDGYEATTAIRALDRVDAQAVPIIAMTADAYADDVKRCLDVGMVAHVSKPVDPDTLHRELARWMD